MFMQTIQFVEFIVISVYICVYISESLIKQFQFFTSNEKEKSIHWDRL